MRFSITLAAGLAGLAVAAPGELQKRQATQNDIKNGAACKKATLIFARASTETGNMGSTMGPAVCSGLKSKLGGSVACQGVGSPYTAGLIENVSAKGTSEAAIGEAQKMFKLTIQKCPETLIVAGGYSQGTAVMMNAISTLPEDERSKIVGVVLFGYTKNGQTKGTIPNYPDDRLKVFCEKSDGVCWGQLSVSGGHFAYIGNGDGTEATKFLLGKINNPSSGGVSSSPSAEAAPKAPPKASPKGPKGKGSAGPGGLERRGPVGRDF